MFNAINDIWNAVYSEDNFDIFGKKVSAELASEFYCDSDGHLTIEDWDGNWVEIDEHKTIVDAGTLGM